VAALGVRTRRFVDGLPDKMLEAADSLGLPVIEISEHYAWVDVMNPVFSPIINEQYARLLKSAESHRRFTQLSLDGCGLDEITAALGQLTENPVMLLDRNYTLLHRSTDDSSSQVETLVELLPQLVRERRGRTVEGHSLIELSPSDSGLPWPVLISPLTRADDQYGYLVCAACNSSLTPEDVMAMEQAATVSVLEMLKQQAIEHVRYRFRNNFLYDLTTGKITGEEVIHARAGYVGWSLNERYGLLLLELDEAEGGQRRRSNAFSREGIERAKERVFSCVRQFVDSILSGCLYMQLSGTLTILVPLDDSSRRSLEAALCSSGQTESEVLVKLAQRVRDHIEAAPVRSRATIGVGRVYPRLDQLHRSYREAKRALQLGRVVWGSGAVTHYNNLGVFRILHSANDRELAAFAAEILEPLRDPAGKDNGFLTETLEAYFRHDQKIDEAARRLHVHPNTVRYRLRKVEQLTGLDLGRNEHRMNLEMALKIDHYLSEKIAEDNK